MNFIFGTESALLHGSKYMAIYLQINTVIKPEGKYDEKR